MWSFLSILAVCIAIPATIALRCWLEDKADQRRHARRERELRHLWETGLCLEPDSWVSPSVRPSPEDARRSARKGIL